MPLEISGFEKVELGEFIEGDVVDSTNKLLDSFVKVKDFPVRTWVNESKVRCNIVIVIVKLSFAMLENKVSCSENDLPGDNPVPMSFDGFCRLGGTKVKLKVTNIFDCSVVCAHRVHT